MKLSISAISQHCAAIKTKILYELWKKVTEIYQSGKGGEDMQCAEYQTCSKNRAKTHLRRHKRIQTSEELQALFASVKINVHDSTIRDTPGC